MCGGRATSRASGRSTTDRRDPLAHVRRQPLRERVERGRVVRRGRDDLGAEAQRVLERVEALEPDEPLVRERRRDAIRSHGGEASQRAGAGYVGAMPETVEIAPVGSERLRDVLSDEQFEAFETGAADGRALLDDRTVWNVNSTAKGGGVVELLRPLVGYARGLGIDCRWEVIGGDPGFFDVTKRLHNRLHGAEGDGRPLDDDARATYEGTLRAEGEALAGAIAAATS